MAEEIKKQIIKVGCLNHQYPDKTEVSICGLEFIVNQGEKVVLIGPNGAGKTTLLLHLLGILETKQGVVQVFGINPAKEFDKISHKVGLVLQDVDDQFVGPTVFDEIAFSLVNYGFNNKEVKERVEKIMVDLEISHLKEKIIHYLSGGEKKKVAIASALVLEPELLILDEALAEVDASSTERILEILNYKNKEQQMTIVMATNDLKVAEKIDGTVYVLDSGKIVFRGGFEKLPKEEKKPFTCIH